LYFFRKTAAGSGLDLSTQKPPAAEEKERRKKRQTYTQVHKKSITITKKGVKINIVSDT